MESNGFNFLPLWNVCGNLQYSEEVMKCLYCQEPLEGKKQFCGDAHRMAYRRRTKQGEQPEQNDPEHTTRTFDFVPTRTDKAFEARKPNYYSFGDIVHERTCTICDKPFKTRLQLLRQCSPKCFTAMTDLLTTNKVGKK